MKLTLGMILRELEIGIYWGFAFAELHSRSSSQEGLSFLCPRALCEDIFPLTIGDFAVRDGI